MSDAKHGEPANNGMQRTALRAAADAGEIAVEYTEALHRLLALTDYERTAGKATPPLKYDLRRMEALVARLGNPQSCAPVVHVAGTKGKGSTAAMVTSVLTAAGYRVGLYTSPHLHTFRERIRLGLEPVSEAQFSALVEALWPVAEAMAEEGEGWPTTFEFLTAMAFRHFQDKRVDAQVLEVGLGGRLDATNVAHGSLCLITSLSLDHTEILGDTLDKIAWEKAGIVKEKSTVVSAPQPSEALEVIRSACAAKGAPLQVAGQEIRWERREASTQGQSFAIHTKQASYQLWMPLLGSYQLENASVAISGLECLQRLGFNVTSNAMVQGFNKVQWPGRLEVLCREPLVVVDGAHNPHSMGRLMEALKETFSYQRLTVILGVSADKQLDGMVAHLAGRVARVFPTQSRHPRALPIAVLAEALEKQGVPQDPGGAVADVLRETMGQTGPQDLVLVTGSLFAVAEAREALKGIPGERYIEMEPPVAARQRQL